MKTKLKMKMQLMARLNVDCNELQGKISELSYLVLT
jgi:hypothetical protein